MSSFVYININSLWCAQDHSQITSVLISLSNCKILDNSNKILQLLNMIYVGNRSFFIFQTSKNKNTSYISQYIMLYQNICLWSRSIPKDTYLPHLTCHVIKKWKMRNLFYRTMPSTANLLLKTKWKVKSILGNPAEKAKDFYHLSV